MRSALVLLSFVCLSGCYTYSSYDPSLVDPLPARPGVDIGPRPDAEYNLFVTARSNLDYAGFLREVLRELEYELSLHQDIAVYGEIEIGEVNPALPTFICNLEVVDIDNGILGYVIVFPDYGRTKSSEWPMSHWAQGGYHSADYIARSMARALTYDLIPLLM